MTEQQVRSISVPEFLEQWRLWRPIVNIVFGSLYVGFPFLAIEIAKLAGFDRADEWTGTGTSSSRFSSSTLSGGNLPNRQIPDRRVILEHAPIQASPSSWWDIILTIGLVLAFLATLATFVAYCGGYLDFSDQDLIYTLPY